MSVLARAHTVMLGLAGVLTIGCALTDGPLSPKQTETTGDLEVSVRAEGAVENVPPQFGVSVDGGYLRHVDSNGTTVGFTLHTGSHSVQLYLIPANCTVNGPNPVAAMVVQGKPPAPVSFFLSCTTVVPDWDY